MAKLTLDDIASGYQSLQKINSNNTLVETAVENTLSRDGSAPNYMGADFDMNSHRILNLPTPLTPNEPARLSDITSGAVLTALSLINIVVDTVAALKAYTMSASLVGQLIYVRGFATIGDGGEGLFRITSTNPGSDNGGTQLNSTTSGYYFIRQGVFAPTPQMFGAKGDNSTNDHAALKLWINSGFKRLYLPSATYVMNTTEILTVPGGITMYGDSMNGSILKFKNNVGTANFRINADGVHVLDIQFLGNAGGGTYGFQIGNSATVAGCYFTRCFFNGGGVLQQSIWLHTCNTIRVNQCRFDGIAYGVLQQGGFTCGNVAIQGCTFNAMAGDCVNFNGAGSAGNVLWMIDNYCAGSVDYPTNQTEERAFSFTNCNYVIIRGNQIVNMAGDAPIHCEDIGGFLIIEGNILRDCNASNGNNGYIYLLNSQKYSMISNNWFIMSTGAAATGRAFISTNSNIYQMRLLINGNMFYDAAHNMTAIDLSYYNGQAAINSNHMDGGVQFAEIASSTQISFNGNRVYNTTRGIYDSAVDNGNPSTAATEIDIIGNYLNCTSYSIRSGDNTASAGSPLQWNVKNNNIVGGTGVRVDHGTDIFHTGNTYGSGVTYRSCNLVGVHGGAAAVRCVEAGLNFLIGTGLV